MRRRLVFMAVLTAAAWFLSPKLDASACFRPGPPAVGAGTGRLKIEINTSAQPANQKPQTGSTSR
jgi:hypothetical protein